MVFLFPLSLTSTLCYSLDGGQSWSCSEGFLDIFCIWFSSYHTLLCPGLDFDSLLFLEWRVELVLSESVPAYVPLSLGFSYWGRMGSLYHLFAAFACSRESAVMHRRHTLRDQHVDGFLFHFSVVASFSYMYLTFTCNSSHDRFLIIHTPYRCSPKHPSVSVYSFSRNHQRTLQKFPGLRSNSSSSSNNQSFP